MGRWALAAAGRRRGAGVCRLLARHPVRRSTGATDRRRRGRRRTGSLSFATDVYPLLTICMNCHVPGGAASATSLLFAGNAGDRLPDDPEVRRHLRPRGKPDALQDERQRARRRDHLRRRDSGVRDRLALDSARSATMRIHRRIVASLRADAPRRRARLRPARERQSQRAGARHHHRRTQRRRRRPDHHPDRHHQPRDRHQLHLRQRQPGRRHRRRHRPRHRRRARPDQRDGDRRRDQGHRQHADRRRGRQRRRSRSTTPGRCPPTRTARPRPSTTGTRRGASPSNAPAATAARGSSTISGATAARRWWSTSRRRPARSSIARPATARPPTRLAQVTFPSGVHGHRPRRRGALHDLPSGTIVGARPSTPTIAAAAPADDDTVSADAQVRRRPLHAGRRHALRRAGARRLRVRRSELRRPVPPRRRHRHLHRRATIRTRPRSTSPPARPATRA